MAALALGAYGARPTCGSLARWLALGLAGAVVVGASGTCATSSSTARRCGRSRAARGATRRRASSGSIDATFVQRPIATLDGRLGDYAERIGGGVLCRWSRRCWRPGVAVVAGRRRADRALVLTGGLAALGLVAWSMAWGTGLQSTSEVTDQGIWSLSATLPAYPRRRRWIVTLRWLRARRSGGRLAEVALGGVLVWNLAVDVPRRALHAPRAHPRRRRGRRSAALGLGRLARGRLSCGPSRRRLRGGRGARPGGGRRPARPR